MEENNNRHKELGAFILAKRNDMSPSDFHYLEKSRRRTPGLRREEVAFLAKIGVSWYTWIEQGKPIKISRRVLENICTVLNLSRKEVEYVFSLADLAPPKVHSFTDGVRLSYKNMMSSLLFSPAFIIDRFFNIIYWNKCFDFIFPDINLLCEKERNLLFISFTSERYKAYCSDWEKTAREILSQFRLSYSKFVDEPLFVNKIERLKKESTFFCECWAENYVSSEKDLIKIIAHPELGELVFEQTSYVLDTEDHAFLKMYIETPVLGTDTEVKICKALSE